ncbi:MAG: putative TIM-barrel fold metal-dependent hydrolase [Sphingobacteriales bacterium]|nr:putative TIM-barrel fold metal-dependent hydrolase [Sphingobacteriales bacterium]
METRKIEILVKLKRRSIFRKYFLITFVSFLILGCNKRNEAAKTTQLPIAPPVDRFKELKIIDVHNHDASDNKYLSSFSLWNKYSINKVVLFGDVSEPPAIITDEIAWQAYKAYPNKFYPFFSGFNLHDSTCLNSIKNQLEKGYFGLGEVVANSTNSPVVSKVAWKGFHAMDGYLPEIYKLIAKYKAPILLHIDPVDEYQIKLLDSALTVNPQTNIILGHANAYSDPKALENLLIKHKNFYYDFFAGFNAYNPERKYNLIDFVEIANKYPDQFLISSDSGYGITYEQAYSAIHQFLNLISSDEIVAKIASGNFERLMDARKNAIK